MTTAPLLHVDGTHLKDPNGNIVTLKGMALDYDEAMVFGNMLPSATISYMKQWGINAIRIPLGSQDGNGNWIVANRYSSNILFGGKTYMQVLDDTINTALSNGMYVILDGWHGGADINYFTSQTWSDWVTWWTTVAQRYAGKGIIYDLMNEPINWDYADHQSRIMSMISTIRSYDSSSINMIEMLDWSFAYQASNPITGTNLVFSPHCYADTFAVDQTSIRNWFNSYAANLISQGLCIVIGEFGGDETVPPKYGGYNSPSSCTWIQNFLTVCDADGRAGYSAWWWTGAWQNNTTLNNDWYGANRNASGAVIHDYYLSFQPTIPWSEYFANLNAWTIVDGTWTLISGGVQGTGIEEALMYAGNPTWTDYAITAPITISAAGEGSIVFRYKDSQNFYWAGLGLWGHQFSISKVVNGNYSEIKGIGLSTDNAAGTYNTQVIVQGSDIELYVNGVLVLTATDTALTSGAIGLRTFGSTMQLKSVNVTTPITPTYFINWAITPVSGNLPFTVNFSGYLSRYSNTPDAGTIVNGETIQLQVLSPGSSTWVNTYVIATTGPGTSGNGYFSGTWGLAEPRIYPGPWQFRAYYAGNTTKYLLGCGKPQKTRDLSRVNALIL
jgi:hypothetical protein